MGRDLGKGWEKVGKVDVLINNAGMGGNHSKVGEGDALEWWSVQVCTFPDGVAYSNSR